MKHFTNLQSPPSLPAKPLAQALDLIAPQLAGVENRIREQARFFDPAVEGYIAYACQSHGKRLRPALALLAGGATGGIQPEHADLAVVLELIHAATLVHDDIIDSAEMRRGQPTANAKWGNTISVLLGDCLFAHALKISTTFEKPDVSRRIAHAASEVCSGEIIQTQRRFDLKLSTADYFRIIEMKTAALFSAATELGAMLNDAPPAVTDALKLFGLKFGTAYQVYDDCLDIAGSETSAGKTLGTDLKKGKLTLPILTLLQNATDARHEKFCECILRGEPEDAQLLAVAARCEGALRSAIFSAKDLLGEAQVALEAISQNPHCAALHDLCDSVLRLVDQFAD